ncbi:cell division protein ZapE [Oceanobacter mangrovi]|uniref:cell division protein ZapE n=1 Tax=Oceanobacter mangrovi TaxID=2862510 RepID=UPI001C8E17D9|nr:cell division protein ZapE [Oceanobacter mangrovi]
MSQQVPEVMSIDRYFADHQIQLDETQQQVIETLMRLQGRACKTVDGFSLLKKPLRSAYMWGRPGRGKTMLMDALFANAQLPAKRIHYHNFLRDLHDGMNANHGETDYLAVMANRVADEYRMYCLDEFHLHDVADVILLERFLEVLLKRQVFVVLTSNYEPVNLLPDPDVHHRALGCIAMIEKYFEVMTLNGERDYRYRDDIEHDCYFSPADSSSEAAIIERLGLTQIPPAEVAIKVPVRNRFMPVRMVQERPDDSEEQAGHEGIVWLDFREACEKPHSHLDYLALVECYDSFVVTGISANRLLNPNTLRRLIWLVDVLYEYRRRLLLTAEQPIIELLQDERFEEDTTRLISRLMEMQSSSY